MKLDEGIRNNEGWKIQDPDRLFLESIIQNTALSRSQEVGYLQRASFPISTLELQVLKQ
jgi:hypothetical protein